jgi:hypothetical protein
VVATKQEQPPMTFRTVNTRYFMYQTEFKIEFEDGSTKWVNRSELEALKAKGE